jgi:hypothetical protein
MCCAATKERFLTNLMATLWELSKLTPTRS